MDIEYLHDGRYWQLLFYMSLNECPNLFAFVKTIRTVPTIAFAAISAF